MGGPVMFLWVPLETDLVQTSASAAQLSQPTVSSHMNGFTGKLETQEGTNWHFCSRQLVKRSFILSLDQQVLKPQAHAVGQVSRPRTAEQPTHPDQTKSLEQ